MRLTLFTATASLCRTSSRLPACAPALVLTVRRLSVSAHTMSTTNGAHPAVNGSKPLDILLIGLGSIGAVYSHILERVRMRHERVKGCC